MAVEKIEIRFNEDDLTIGDLEDFETVAGASLFDALKPVPVRDEEGNVVKDEKGRPVAETQLSAVALKALVWIVLRQERPGFTLDDARNIKVTALELVTSDDDADAAGNDAGQGSADATSV